ncbi:MAG: hypothetical protein Q9182_004281 [Xanthomendoza sp. 2 TL-2023]
MQGFFRVFPLGPEPGEHGPDVVFADVLPGPAGCLLACRLASAFKHDQILLIEAGGENKAPEHQGFGDRNFTLGTAPGFNWGYKTVPQKNLGQRELDYSRGKGLGGSTAINFCVWTRGPSSDYDRWAHIVEDDAWGWSNVQERYKKIEKVTLPSKGYERYVDFGDKVSSAHGYVQWCYRLAVLRTNNSEVEIGFPKRWDPDFGRYLDETQYDGYPRALDINSGNPIGLGVLQSNIAKHCKWEKSYRSHCSFVQRAQNSYSNDSDYFLVFAKREVILSAGALDTPKILLLSGIGPRSELEKLDIPCVKEISGVGNNLHDRLFMELVTVRKPGTPHRTSYLPSSPEHLDAARKQWAQDESGPFSQFFLPQMIGFIKSKSLVESQEFKLLDPEVQATLQAKTTPHLELVSHILSPLIKSPEEYLAAAVSFMSLQSNGTVTLRSKDPSDPPLIDPKFLDDAFDKRVAIEAVREAMKFLNSPSLKKIMSGSLPNRRA